VELVVDFGPKPHDVHQEETQEARKHEDEGSFGAQHRVCLDDLEANPAPSRAGEDKEDRNNGIDRELRTLPHEVRSVVGRAW